jgi:hypothetical protein
VVEEDADAAGVETFDGLFQGGASAGEFVVIGELVAGIDAGVGVVGPEDDKVVAAEVAFGAVEKAVHLPLARFVVDKFVVPEHDKALGVGSGGPGLGGAVIAWGGELGPFLFGPGLEAIPPGGPLVGQFRGGEESFFQFLDIGGDKIFHKECILHGTGQKGY